MHNQFMTANHCNLLHFVVKKKQQLTSEESLTTFINHLPRVCDADTESVHGPGDEHGPLKQVVKYDIYLVRNF